MYKLLTTDSKNIWKIQILDQKINEYITYIESEMTENDYGRYIMGYYFGSSTRQGELGTFYYNDTKEIIPLKLRIINNNLETILEIEITNEIIKDIIDSNHYNQYKINNIKIYYRVLHRFKNYPFEISGIVLLK